MNTNSLSLFRDMANQMFRLAMAARDGNPQKAIQYYDEGLTTMMKVLEAKEAEQKASAALENLFKIDEDSEKLNTVQATAFHHIVAKALYLVKRARPDALLAIAFLTTRVQAPDVYD
jgi:putative heme degradation protein